MNQETLDSQASAAASATQPVFFHAPHWKWLPDIFALVYGLGLAWVFKWEARDLIWSLWLSSFVVGYATILLSIYGPLFRRGGAFSQSTSGLKIVEVIGAVFMTGFFTVHFSGFHFVHSIFLNQFFPVGPHRTHGGFIDPSVYWIVFTSYWPFVLATALSERAALLQAVRGPAAGTAGKNFMMAPYKNVIRMHLLIFFFAAAIIAKLDSFIIYAVVFCVYFFPFRYVADLLKQRRTDAA